MKPNISYSVYYCQLLYFRQSVIVQPHFEYEHARELQMISDLLDEVPHILELVHGDMVRSLFDPGAGRKGMTAEQVRRALIVKQMNGFSYELLAFHLSDSRSYRAFCRLRRVVSVLSKGA